MKNNAIRSPFFYVGDKYKLMPQLQKLFPDDIESYIEPFAGGGSSFLNTKAKKYIVNDIDSYVIKLHKKLSSFSNDTDSFINFLYKLIDEYGLSCSYRGITVSEELKKKYIKTYYSHYNKDAYINLRNDYNKDGDLLKLYLLLIYGFNHMIRFNTSGIFNLPVGNVDFNKNVYNAICNYMAFMKKSSVDFYNMDYIDFLNQLDILETDYVYFDPPYLISDSEYNKLWNESKEIELCDCIDKLDKMGIHFGITNLVNHKGKHNNIFMQWSKKYRVYAIDSNYISFNDNTIKENSKEVFVTNYGK
ncbi:Dam family site-specific DNA-(adenine-N6)-methyltransferase [Candidatus Pseudoruminococcus sp.]|uniref:Dam family site-specific DNA-(adenine-N6)-methyltransferase n=1 Tax=Candidatus Pseudoruminococcus sp. TaxID=3101048 RepID=UPI00399A3122